MEFGILSGATVKDRLRIIGLLARRAGRSIRRLFTSPLQAAMRFRAPVPDRLLIAPQDIRTGDPTIAADIGAGYFAFGGKIVNAHGRSPFALEPGSDAWARQLNGFGWMRHLRVAGDPVLKSRAKALVDEFLKTSGRPTASPAWDAQVTARRMLAWLSQSPIILEGSDRAFYGRFMAALVTARFHLERQIREGLAAEPRLLAAIALAEFGLCTPGAGPFQKQGTDLLVAEIKAQILADGGHVGRNPQQVIDLLLDLLPLRQAYAARGIQVPAPILNAIDRMMPILRLFRHGDGTLALFNGMGLTAPELVATILAYDDARAQPLSNAPYSGYQRLDARETVLIVDAGPIPPMPFSTQAHAGCLSFEFSSGFQRIVVNCGAPEVGRADARTAARQTAAHSTLVLDDTSSCRFATHAKLQKWLRDQILAGPSKVTMERLHADVFTTLKLSHDGYEARFGLVHVRELWLSGDGATLEGRDALEETGKRKAVSLPFALRFHLHPSVKARLVGNDTAVLIELRDGDPWLFQADASLTLEPSILFATSGGPRQTTQIHVSARTDERPTIHWAFRRRPSLAPSMPSQFPARTATDGEPLMPGDA